MNGTTITPTQSTDPAGNNYVSNGVSNAGTNGYVNAQGTYVPPTQSSPVSPTIDASRLGTATPTPIPNNNNSATAGANLGVAAGNVVGNAATAQTATPTTGTSTTGTQTGDSSNGVLSYIKNLIGIESTKGDFTTKLQNENGLSDKIQALNDVNNEALATEKSWNDQIKAARQNSHGTVAGVNETINRLTMQKNDDLANIGIRQKVAQGNVQAANDIINAKVSAKFQPIEDNIKNLTDYYNLRKNDLSESEIMKLQGQIDQQKSALTFKQNAYKDAVSQAAQNGAPQSVLNAIDKAAADPNATPSSIYSAAGKYAESSTMFVQNGTNTDITPGSAQYKIAQDLAYGALTFSQFKSMFSYSKNTGQKQAIYQLASELNPQFNPSSFELGYTMANNPKVRQQIAALDNVQGIIPDILSASSEAARSGITSLNKAIIKGGVLIGNSKYSNLQSAQVAFADELSGALGFGSATDMSREMGFNMADTSLSAQQFADGINNIVIPFIAQKRSSLLNQMGVYGNTINGFSNGGSSGSSSGSSNGSAVSSDVQSILDKYGVKLQK